MNAKEMFEELGYWKNTSECYTDTHIKYEKSVMNDTDIFTIEFKNGLVLYTNTFMSSIWTDAQTVKSIHQQLIELGWI